MPILSLLRAVALGAASGARTSAGVAAVALTSVRGDRGRLASGLGSRAGRAVSGLLAAGELVVDKLPSTPSRLAPPGLIPRVVFGATSAGAIARRDGTGPALPALVAAAGALGTAVLGTRWRTAAQRRTGSDLAGALIEDVAAVLLAWLGTRRPR